MQSRYRKESARNMLDAQYAPQPAHVCILELLGMRV